MHIDIIRDDLEAEVVWLEAYSLTFVLAASRRTTQVPRLLGKELIVPDFTDAQVTYLKSQRLGRLATLRPDGSLQNNPVGFRFDEATGTFEIGGLNMGNSRKYKNVESNGQVAFVVDDLETIDPWKPRMVEIRGMGELIPASDPRKSLIRIHPMRVISFGIQ